MPHSDQQGIDPTPVSRLAGFRNRVAAKLETNPAILRAKMRSDDAKKAMISYPLPPPLPHVYPVPRPPPFDPFIAYVPPEPKLGKRVTKKAGKARNWSKATNASLDMVSDSQQPWDDSDELTATQQYHQPNRIRRSRIVRYNMVDQYLRLVTKAEEDDFYREQEQRRASANSTGGHSNLSLDTMADTMLDNMYIVDEGIRPEMTRAIIKKLGVLFHHIPFTIVGGAALVYYGMERTVSRITIGCPKEYAQNLFNWARVKGMYRFQDDWKDSFGCGTTENSMYRVRVRILKEDHFNYIRAPRRDVGESATVMTLPNIINEYAGLYVAGVRKLAGHEVSRIAEDIMWMLRRVAALRRAGRAEHDQMFVASEISWILSGRFWLPFTQKYPESAELFRDAGVFRCVTRSPSLRSPCSPDKTDPISPLRSVFLRPSRPESDESSRKSEEEQLELQQLGILPPTRFEGVLRPRPARVASLREPRRRISSCVASPVGSTTSSTYSGDLASGSSDISDADVREIGEQTSSHGGHYYRQVYEAE